MMVTVLYFIRNEPLTEKLLSWCRIKGFSLLLCSAFIFFLRNDIYSLYWGRFYIWASDCVRYNKDFVIIEVCYIEVLFHTFYCNFGPAGLKNICSLI